MNLTKRPSPPVVRRLAEGFSIESAFDRLSHLPGCLWLDSAHRPDDADASKIGRYSFLTADPVRQLVAFLDDHSPWAEIQTWCRELPDTFDPDLPPFQGGIAGLFGYEAGSWLEPVGLARINDLPTATVSLGLYDWTIAVDHKADAAWLISQGLSENTASKRAEVAERRADQVESLLSNPLPFRQSSFREGEAPAGPQPSTGITPHEQVAHPSQQHSTRYDGITSNFSGAQFRARVAEIVRRICDGDSFQVNLAQRLLSKATLSSPDLYRKLRSTNPAPFGGYFCGGDFQVLSSSPEGFLTVRDRIATTRPIKGTIGRTSDADRDRQLALQLEQSEKDRAENIMIVDLMRNDLSRVCEDDSVMVRKLCRIERYQYVQHLVSVVEGRLRDDQTVVDLLQACFPGGSVTGAPKIEAMRTIASLEPNHRGPYCGSLGYISCGGAADFNILIRTITAAHGYWQIPVGGGITARSDPAAEEAETWNKAEGMLRAVLS